MDVSYRWLQRHVDLEGVSPGDLARELTLHTAEVEDLRPFAPALGTVVVGHVVSRERHPDADKLSLCRVDVGNGDPLQIVCGAPNVDARQNVAVATVGAVLPGDFKIKKSKIRGVESRGMICSERELGLGEEHDGIWVLPEGLSVGAPVAEALGSIEGPGGVRALDWIVEIDNKSLTHRPDLWGHRGIAAEVAAIRGLPLKPLDLELPPTGDGAPFPVRIETAGCSRYVALPIEGVQVTRSPDWLRMLLLAAGQRPLDLLVDVSNFVMLDLGQPNHLFDGEALRSGIVVRDARPGERMTTLDGTERELGPEDMLICDGDEPVALAGVMGGEGSKVNPGTHRLLLEVASFHPVTVRRTASRLGLRSSASARFEKHLDPTLPGKAAAHLVNFLRELGQDVRLPAPPTDAGDWTDPARTVRLRGARVRSLLGVELSTAEIGALLERLHFGVAPGADADELAVSIPSARATKDLSIEEDLVEEVGRLIGYDRIPEQALTDAVHPMARDERRVLVRRVQDRLSGGARFHEARTHTFLPAELAAALGVADEPYVRVVNPASEGLERVRRGVVPSLLGRLETNLRERPEVRLFEIGKGYRPEVEGDRGQPAEVHEVALVLAAPRPGPGARFDAGAQARLTGVVDDVVRTVRRRELTWSRAEGPLPGWAHPGRTAVGAVAEAGEGPPVALVTELDPVAARRLGLEEHDVAAAWIAVDALAAVPIPRSWFQPLPRFPGVKVDVALECPEELAHAELAAAVEKAGKGLVRELELFDLYRGENLGAGRKSLAYHVLLQAADRTLTDKDCARFLDRVERAAGDLGARLRRE